MRSPVINLILLSIIMSFFPQSVLAASGQRTDHIFVVEHSKNKNFVQYDAGLTENNGLPDSRPIKVYWILENGRHEELNSIEKNYAYGIVREERLCKDKLKIILAGFKNLEIIIERIDSSFKAVVFINGRETIIEKIYLKSEETSLFPRVIYVDLFGWIKETGLAVRERIIPSNSDNTGIRTARLGSATVSVAKPSETCSE